MAGQYRSVFRGAGIEFEEVREYAPGDEVKSIDWKVSARLGKPFIKRYREEREQIVMLVVDMSASGGFGTTDRTKREKTAEMAAIIAFNAIRNNDKAGAILFTDKVEKYIPPKKGAGHVWRLIREIFTFSPSRSGTDITGAVGYLARVCRKRSVAFLISDFLVADFGKEQALRIKAAAKSHEMINVIVSDPGEFRLPSGGIVSFRDLETGKTLLVDAWHKETRNEYEKKMLAHYNRIHEALKSLDMDVLELSTRHDAADVLTKYFRVRERRKR